MCTWTLDSDPDYSVWNTECKNAFIFTEEGPKENGFNYCPYCGDAMRVKAPSSTGDTAP